MEENKLIFPFALDKIEDETAWGKEIWNLADLGFKDSTVHRGILEGNPMSDVMETYLERIVGDDTYYYFGRQFPVLVKTLIPSSRTPLVVCPDDEVSEQRYDSLGKLKLWYVASAQPGAKLHMGFSSEISATDFYNKCLDGSIDERLNSTPANKGDCWLIRPGMVHFADKGVKIIEIAESSDLDLRLCNWGKTADNQDDPVFLEEAFDLVNLKASTAELLPGCRYSDQPEFTVNRLDLTDPLHILNNEESSGYSVYHCVEGEVAIQTPATDENDKKYVEMLVLGEGETAIVPAEIPDFYLVKRTSDAVLLEVTPGKKESPETYINAETPSTEPEYSTPAKHNKIFS